jgi:hypothetical protein
MDLPAARRSRSIQKQANRDCVVKAKWHCVNHFPASLETEMFGFLSNLIDRSPDAEIQAALGSAAPKYVSSVSRIGLTLAMFTVSFGLMLVVWFIGTHIRPTEYRLVNVAKQEAAQMYTMDRPVISGSHVERWASRALSDTLTFDFVNVDTRLSAAGVYYTPAAQQSMQAAIAKDKIIETVKASHLTVALTPTSPPRIVKPPYAINGVMYWELEAPVILTYTGASKQEARGMIIRLRIKEVPATETPDGLEIAGFFSEPALLN